MTPERHARISEIFVAVADAAPERRAALLAELCAGDAELQAAVEALLMHDQAPALLDRDLNATLIRDAARSDHDSPHDAVGRTIGGYEIVGVLGQGGMGVVYRARQRQPARMVALKVVNAALATPDMLRRFEFEAAVLARLSHPGIAQIFEAGVTGRNGRRLPFFAMELVEGLPLTEYAHRNLMDPPQRLRLIAAVCDAVQHAHQRGVIHRDLKPANILVVHEGVGTWEGGNVRTGLSNARSHIPTFPRSHGSTHAPADAAAIPRSDAARPKILDFGIARTLDGDGAARTMLTQAGQIVGTLAYMSPEQVSGDPALIDTRTDIYALGVIAFELLSGRLPHELRGKTIAQAATEIRDAPPPRLGAIQAALRGDVETIVGKALEKDKEQRYATAAEMAADIQRCLRDEPILARAPTIRYRVRKFVRRNRVPVAAAGVAALALVAATVVSIIFAVGELRERRRTQSVARFQSQMLREIDPQAMGAGIKARLHEQVKAGLERQYVADGAEWRKRTAGEIDAALESFDAAMAPAAFVDVARRTLDEYVLGRAGESLDTEFKDQPLVRAQLHQAIGASYESLGVYEKAERHLSAALDLRRATPGSDEEEMIDLVSRLARVAQEQQDLERAEPLQREALERAKRRFGPRHERTAAHLSNYAGLLLRQNDFAASEALYRDAEAIIRDANGDRSEQTASALLNLAEALRLKGDWAGAEGANREALAIHRALGSATASTAIVLNNLSQVLSSAGRQAEAEPLQREALEILREKRGDEHPDTLTMLCNLASTLRAGGNLGEAEPAFREALELSKRIYGDGNPEMAASLLGLGMVVQERGDLDAAAAFQRQALALLRAQLGPRHADVGTAMNNLAAVLHGKRDLAGAEPLYREALDIRRAALGPEHPDVAWIENNLAALLRDRGDFAAAEPLYREAARLFRTLGEANRPLQACLAGLARTLHGLGKFAEAEAFFRESLAMQEAMPPVNQPFAAQTEARLARTVIKLARYVEAEGLLNSAWKRLGAPAAGSPPAPQTFSEQSLVMEAFIELYDQWEAAEPGGGHGEKAAEWRARVVGK